MRNSTGSPLFSDFKSDLSRVVRSRPLVKGNEDAGYEGDSRPKRSCTVGMRNSTGSPLFSDFKSDLSRVVRSRPLVKGNEDAGYEGGLEVSLMW